MNQLKVAHWNCFKLTQSRQFELKNFLNIFKPDIISLQELKLNEEEARLCLRIVGYSVYIKPRKVNPEHGGGVAVLIRSGISYSIISGLDESLEIMGIKIELNEVCFDFFTLYSPPNKDIPYEFFKSLDNSKSEFVIVGDLNSKTKSIGCKSQDSSGAVLDEVLTDTSIIVFNNKNPTFFQKQGAVRIQSNKEQYTEILDLALGSPNMADKVRNFQVLNDHIMDSDHCPIYFDLKLSGHTVLNNDDKKVRLNFAKADWVQFRNILDEKAKDISEYQLGSMNINKLNELISNQILEVVEKSVPKFLNKSNNSLPKEIVDLIMIKRETRKGIRKSNSTNLKTYYNKLTAQIKILIKNYREKLWNNMLEKFGPYPVSSRIWQKINQARSNKQSGSIHTLVKESVEYKTNDDKVKIFASMLSTSYAAIGNQNEYDKSHKIMVNKLVNKYIPKKIYSPFFFDL